jgi:hypothetical protein
MAHDRVVLGWPRGTPDEVATVGALLIDPDTGSDFLMQAGVTAAALLLGRLE